MGQHIDHQSLSIFNNNYEWHFVRSYLNYKIVYDTHSKLLAEQYDIKCANQQSWKIYQMRKNNSKLFVNVYQAIITNSQFLCNGINRAKIYIERIPFRLSDLGQLSFCEGLYVLSVVLSASEKICKYFSPVLIDENMICFNMYGQCKIWINENLECNEPTFSYNNPIKEEQIVENIMKVIENRIQFCSKYYKEKRKIKITQFCDAIEFVNRLRRQSKNNKSNVQIPCIDAEQTITKKLQEKKQIAQNSRLNSISKAQSQSQSTITPPTDSQIKYKISCKAYAKVPKMLQKNIKGKKSLLASPQNKNNNIKDQHKTPIKQKHSLYKYNNRMRSCQKLEAGNIKSSIIIQNSQYKSTKKRSLKKNNIRNRYVEQILKQHQISCNNPQEKIHEPKFCLSKYERVIGQQSQTQRSLLHQIK